MTFYDLIICDIDNTIYNGNVLERFIESRYSFCFSRIHWRFRPFVCFIFIYFLKPSCEQIESFISNDINNSPISPFELQSSCSSLIFVSNCWSFRLLNSKLFGFDVITSNWLRYISSNFDKQDLFLEIVKSHPNDSILFVGDLSSDSFKHYDFFKV